MDDLDWQADAICREIGVEMFFPEKGGAAQAAQARKICEGCLARLQCLEYAMDYEGGSNQNRRAGVFGGLGPVARYDLAVERGWVMDEEEFDDEELAA